MSRRFPHASTPPGAVDFKNFHYSGVFSDASVGNATYLCWQHTSVVVYGCVPELDTKGAPCKRQVRSSIALRSLIKDWFACINNSISKSWYKQSWTLVLHDASPLHSWNAVVVACCKQWFSSFAGKKKLISFYHVCVGLLEFTSLYVEIAPTFWRTL